MPLGPSLRDVDLANVEHEWNIPSFIVYISVNGQPLTTPSKKNVDNLERPIGESVEHKVRGTYSKYNISADVGLANVEHGWNIPSFNVYISVNGQPPRTPSKKNVDALERLIGESVEHKVRGTYSKWTSAG